jgi:hypothetical protein
MQLLAASLYPLKKLSPMHEIQFHSSSWAPKSRTNLSEHPIYYPIRNALKTQEFFILPKGNRQFWRF